MVSKPELRIGSLEQKTVDRFKEIQSSLNLKYPRELLEILLETYEKVQNNDSKNNLVERPDPLTLVEELNNNDRLEVEKALNSGADSNYLIKIGLVAEAKRWNAQNDKRSQFEGMGYLELKRQRIKGAAEERIKRAIKAIMNHNKSCELETDKLYITAGAIQSITGSNQKAIANLFKDPEILKLLENHHKEQALQPHHNSRFDVNVNNIVGSIKGELEKS